MTVMMVLVAKENKSTVSFMISYCVMPFSCSKLMHKNLGSILIYLGFWETAQLPLPQANILP